MSYPIFLYYGLAYHRIEDEQTYLEVEDDDFGTGISLKKKAGNIVKTMIDRDQKITEACFNNHYQSALSKMNKFLDIPESHEDKVNREDRAEEITAGARESFILNWREGK